MSLKGNADVNINLNIFRGKIRDLRPYLLDKTLSVDGAAADAKATGEAIAKMQGTVEKHVETVIKETVPKNAVLYTAQTLTEEQQDQARKNIGIKGKDAYYDVDLTSLVTLDGEDVDVSVTSAVNGDEIWNSVEAGLTVRVRVQTDQSMFGNTVYEPAVFHLTTAHYAPGVGVRLIGITNDLFKQTTAKVTLTLAKSSGVWSVNFKYAMENIVSTDEDGFTVIEGLPGVDAFKLKKSDNAITVTTTMENEDTHNDVITIENNVVKNIVSDGRTIAVTVEGFDG